VTFSIRDTDAWLQRYVGAAWRLLNMLSPITSLVHSEWPIFRALHIGSLLRRHPRPWVPNRLEQEGEVSAELRVSALDPTSLVALVREALRPAPRRAVYLTAAWGHMAGHIGAVVARWVALEFPRLLLLALDRAAAEECQRHRLQRGRGRVRCIEMPQRFGVEAGVAKYLAMSVVAQSAPMAVWMDLDVYLPADPTAALERTFEESGFPPLAMGTTLTSRSLSPCFFAARGGVASRWFLKYAAWLYEHPYILDHQGWDAFLRNADGDFYGGWDYKGRNITSDPGDGLQLSFAPPDDTPDEPPSFAVLGREFASGDGFAVPLDQLAAFHFWGALENQAELFSVFYPYERTGFRPAARAVLRQYARTPVSLTMDGVAARAQGAAHITAITYASGCCEKSIERNRRSALSVGVDAAHAYGFSDLAEDWAAAHASVLSQRRGGGWWLWKPYLILRTLRDDRVPWHTGVVLWLDAGNFYAGDPRPVVAEALRGSDVAAMRLKCCIESDWTSAVALEKLGGSGFAIADTPQLGAYFLILRKTTKALAFVEEWLMRAEDPDILLEAGGEANLLSAPSYQRHMADQSIFSVLFKQYGFEAMSLEDGHKAVQLDRWRE